MTRAERIEFSYRTAEQADKFADGAFEIGTATKALVCALDALRLAVLATIPDDNHPGGQPLPGV